MRAGLARPARRGPNSGPVRCPAPGPHRSADCTHPRKGSDVRTILSTITAYAIAWLTGRARPYVGRRRAEG